MSARLFIALLAAGSSLPLHAAELFTGLKASDCADGQVPNEILRDKAIAAAKVPLSTAIAGALLEGRLGTVARDAQVACLSTTCEGANAALGELHQSLLDLAEAAPLVPDGFTIAIDVERAPRPAARSAAFLNGEWGWVRLRCTTALADTSAASSGDKPVRHPADGAPAKLVIGKNEEDLGKDFAKRGFASFGLSSDREANETAWDIDAYLGVDTPILGGNEIEFEPFASLQYHSQKKVDDLAFGGALLWYPSNSGHLVKLKGAWESDINFRSSLWRGELGWTPPWFDICERTGSPSDHYANCELTLVGDVQKISDPGRKDDLLTLSSFGRIGFDARLVYGHSIGDSFGFVIATAGYSLRERPGNGGGDADLFAASLGLSPSKTGAWKMSLDYTKGRDLTALTKQDKIVITVGFRH